MKRALLRPIPFFVPSLLGLGLILLDAFEASGFRSPFFFTTGVTKGPALMSGTASRIFHERCQGCHEEDGSGRAMRIVVPEIPDFTNPRWQRARQDAHLAISIIEGKGSRMPAFGGRIDRKQAQELVAFIRSFAPRSASQAETAADGDFTVRFRELQEEYQRLCDEIERLASSRKMADKDE
jgi:hypothetical protein